MNHNGKKIRLIAGPHCTGIIISADYDRDQFIIRWDDPRLATCSLSRDSFEIITETPVIKCECGVDITGIGGLHSTWCVLYEDNYD